MQTIFFKLCLDSGKLFCALYCNGKAYVEAYVQPYYTYTYIFIGYSIP